MYSLSANQNYREQRKIEKMELKKAKDLQKSIERSKSSSFAKVAKQTKSNPDDITVTENKKRQHEVIRLDIRFSIFTRLLYAEPKTGICPCITCEDKAHWKEMEAGHWIDRANYKYRRDERNVHVQCKTCNGTKNGCKKVYKRALIHKYGELTVQHMEEDIYNPIYDKIPTEQITEYANRYQKLCMGLLRDKGLTL